MEDLIPNELRFKNQFYLRRAVRTTSQAFPDLLGWRHFSLRNHVYLAVQNSLQVEKHTLDDREFVCLGDIIDPRSPYSTNLNIVRCLTQDTKNFQQLEKNISSLAGRWVLIATLGSETRIYHDACGLKSVYYFWCEKTGDSHVASQPLLLEAAGVTRRDTELQRRYYQYADRWKYDQAHWPLSQWPVNIVPYFAVNRLVPNHYLELQEGRPVRFWPKEDDSVSVKLADAVDRMSTLTQGTIRALAHRGNCFLGLTGGLDSRFILACCDFAEIEINLFTIQSENTPTYDIEIPRVLSDICGYQHSVIPRADGDLEVLEVLHANAGLLDMGYVRPRHIFAQLGVVGDGYLLSGLIGEVCRTFYYYDHPSIQSAEDLASMTGFNGNHVAIEGFSLWLQDLPHNSGINILDLFYWEHRVGVWGATGLSFQEALIKHVPPLNNREVLEIGLAVPLEMRRNPYELFVKMLNQMAPQLGEVPVNKRLQDN